MQIISKEYSLLFNAVTDAEETLAQLRPMLIDAQRRAEELYLDQGEDGTALREPTDSLPTGTAGGQCFLR